VDTIIKQGAAKEQISVPREIEHLRTLDQQVSEKYTCFIIWEPKERLGAGPLYIYGIYIWYIYMGGGLYMGGGRFISSLDVRP
jgi:hypothetical protein